MRDEVRRNDRIDDDTAPLQYEDFFAYLPQGKYIFIPTRELWPAKSVNARLSQRDKLKPSAWLDENRAVMQLTWAPGEPELIENKVIDNAGFIDDEGSHIFNSYRAPPDPRGLRAGNVTRWLRHIVRLYGKAAARHIVRWFAYRVQHPNIKINHALVLAGNQGIGKDMILAAVRHAVGTWNCESITAEEVMHRNNKFARAVLTIINEAHDLGDFDRFKFYQRVKQYAAALPDVLRINEKFIGEYYIPNLCGVVITSNHKTDGISLEADDRRHFAVWSDCAKEDFDQAYWDGMWRWYESGGFEVIARYLATLDVDSKFNPKKPPPKTEALWEIVNASRATEDAELADLIDDMRLARAANGGDPLVVLTIRRLPRPRSATASMPGLPRGFGTRATRGASRIGSTSATSCLCATRTPRTACGRSTAGDRWSTARRN